MDEHKLHKCPADSQDDNIKAVQKATVTAAISTSFITTFSGSALNLAIPNMGTYFNMGAASVGWLITVYTLVVAAFSVPFGKLADSTSRYRVLVTGIIIFGITSIVAVFAPNAAVMLTIRVVQAIGASMIFATNMPIAISAFPGRERGKAIGMVTSGTYAGLALGPVLGGILNNYFGWKSIFIFGALVSLFALIISVRGISRDQAESANMKQDIKGNIFYIIMIASVIYGLSSLN